MVPFVFAVDRRRDPTVRRPRARVRPRRAAARPSSRRSSSPRRPRVRRRCDSAVCSVDGEVKGSIDIPWLGSVIAMNSPAKPVPGSTPSRTTRSRRSTSTHLAFQTMVGIGTPAGGRPSPGSGSSADAARDLLERRWFLRAAAAAGPLAVVALEAGLDRDRGRPAAVDRLRRACGPRRRWATTPRACGGCSGISTVVYAGMTVGAVVVLRSMARRWRAGEVDLPSPYAPDVDGVEAGR